VQEKYTKLLEQARSDLAAKSAENEQLRSQVDSDSLIQRLVNCTFNKFVINEIRVQAMLFSQVFFWVHLT
jgi:hypothetical protein